MRAKVEIIVAASTAAGRAAQQATRTIPIVIVVIEDPVELGFVATLARPGGNVTGIASQGPDIVAKRLQLLKEALPGAARIRLLVPIRK
jgi:putative ABC transport system substrate-binding protein